MYINFDRYKLVLIQHPLYINKHNHINIHIDQHININLF